MEETAQPNISVKFNNLLLDFLKDLISTFPEYEETVSITINNVNKQIDTSEYLDKYLTEFRKHIVKLSQKDISVFLENNIQLIDNIDFSKIWSCENISNQTKNAIWKYIHSLYILGNNITKEDDALSFFKQNTNNTLEDISTQARCLLDMINNLENNKTADDSESSNLDDLDLFGDSKIGKLAQELAGEINIGDLGLTKDMNENPEKLLESIMSGDNSNNLMNMIQTVGSKIQNKITSGEVDETQLLSEAQNMMSSMGNNDMLSNMMKNMGNLGNKMPNNRTRDRLRKKLEKKNKK